ncbi:hypothetical protein F4824DRAFT_422646 [Ustulina deusta]|nr:hypothetical protein F4824DRAFT_422646 [Ustulina deusta]
MHHGANSLASTVSRVALYTSRTVVHGILLPRFPVLLNSCGMVSAISNGLNTAFQALSCTWILARSRHRFLLFRLFFSYRFLSHGRPSLVWSIFCSAPMRPPNPNRESRHYGTSSAELIRYLEERAIWYS